jgi:hypothetical protein
MSFLNELIRALCALGGDRIRADLKPARTRFFVRVVVVVVRIDFSLFSTDLDKLCRARLPLPSHR